MLLQCTARTDTAAGHPSGGEPQQIPHSTPPGVKGRGDWLGGLSSCVAQPAAGGDGRPPRWPRSHWLGQVTEGAQAPERKELNSTALSLCVIEHNYYSE